MKTQHQVILSLGSNQGNRLENIERCIEGLHNEIGTVIRVSKLYETPSWGFESEKFYNCAVILNTHKSAHRILEEVLLLEEALGRVRDAKVEGYQARLIDIDVITFDEEIIASEKLQVPHPEMHNRLFVLLPMRDLNLDWRHPILQKYLHELLVLSEDKSNCKVIQNLEIPIAKIKLDHFNYIEQELELDILDVAMEGTVLQSQAALVLGELSACVRLAIYDFFEDARKYPLKVPPMTLKKYAAGKGNAKKQEMLLQIYKRWGIEFNDDNAADSYALARLTSGNFITKMEEDIVAQMKDAKYRDQPRL